MPLPERVIQPVNISRGTLQYQVQDELEGVTNGTLCNIIRQLSSLSKHAEEIFGNLFKEARNISTRSSNLQARIDKLSIRVTQLDSSVDNGSKSYHPHLSVQKFDQQVLSRDTMPKAMMEAYMACDMPPPLHKLNPYRDDNIDAMTFYTNPKYFFELWRNETLKDTERVIQDRVKKNPNKSNPEANANGILKFSKGDSLTNQRLLEDRHENLGKIQTGNHTSILSGSSVHHPYVSQPQVRPATTAAEEKYSLTGVNPFQNQMFQPRAVSENVQHQQSVRQMPTAAYNLSASEVLKNTPRVLMASNQDQPPSPRYFQTSDRHQATDTYSHFEKTFHKPLAALSMNNNIENEPVIKSHQTSVEAGLREENETKRDHQIDKQPYNVPANPSASVETSVDFVTTIKQDYVSPKFADSPDQDPMSSKEQEFPPPPITEASLVTKISVDPGRLSPTPPPFKEAADVAVTEAPTAPPPPPPPPPSEPPMMNGVTTSVKKETSSNTTVTSTSLPSMPVRKPLILPHFVKQDDARFDLLKAIQDGIVLRKVDHCEKAKIDRDSSFGVQGDVASILARRMAVEMSDSEDGGHGNSDYENDSDEWDDSTA